MVVELSVLRKKIDEVDKALLDLLCQRLSLVAEVGEVKSRAGLPIYAPHREAEILALRRQESAILGVPPNLIEDVLRRLMQESYVRQSENDFNRLDPQVLSVVSTDWCKQTGSYVKNNNAVPILTSHRREREFATCRSVIDRGTEG